MPATIPVEISSLVFDRTEADVERVKTLRDKALNTGWESLTSQERREWLHGMKGAYNYTDMNRVAKAAKYIAQLFKDLPGILLTRQKEKGIDTAPLFTVPYDPASVYVNMKNNWTVNDIPSQSQMNNYLSGITNVITRIPILPAGETLVIPTQLQSMDVNTANNLERWLYLTYAAYIALRDQLLEYIDQAAQSAMYSGEIMAGE